MNLVKHAKHTKSDNNNILSTSEEEVLMSPLTMM